MIVTLTEFRPTKTHKMKNPQNVTYISYKAGFLCVLMNSRCDPKIAALLETHRVNNRTVTLRRQPELTRAHPSKKVVTSTNAHCSHGTFYILNEGMIAFFG